jgi:hypothetical protein
LREHGFSVPVIIDDWQTSEGAVKPMRTRIRLLAQPKSMRSIIGATQREQRLSC